MIKQRWMVVVCALMFGFVTGPMTTLAQAQMFVFENPLVGKQAPDFTLKNLVRKDVNYKALVKGKASIIFFWATWCPHCREAMNEFKGRVQEFKSKNIEMVLVNVGEELKKVDNHVKRNQIPFDILLDEDGAVSEKYAVIGFPTFVFVDQDGVVQDVQHELPSDYEEIFK